MYKLIQSVIKSIFSWLREAKLVTFVRLYPLEFCSFCQSSRVAAFFKLIIHSFHWVKAAFSFMWADQQFIYNLRKIGKKCICKAKHIGICTSYKAHKLHWGLTKNCHAEVSIRLPGNETCRVRILMQFLKYVSSQKFLECVSSQIFTQFASDHAIAWNWFQQHL